MPFCALPIPAGEAEQVAMLCDLKAAVEPSYQREHGRHLIPRSALVLRMGSLALSPRPRQYMRSCSFYQRKYEFIIYHIHHEVLYLTA